MKSSVVIRNILLLLIGFLVIRFFTVFLGLLKFWWVLIPLLLIALLFLGRAMKKKSSLADSDVQNKTLRDVTDSAKTSSHTNDK